MKIPRIRGGAAATLSVLVAATALAAMAPSQALDPAGVGPRDSSRAGFPAFYTDDAGVALQLCVDGTLRCGGATLRSDGAGGPGVVVAPDGEGFYWMATTSLVGPDMELDIEFAAEAAWLDRRTPITFDRVRIRGHADAAGDITVDTPYGAFTVTADDPVNVRNVNFTEDVGCAIGPCNFRAMTTLADAHITDWITSTTPPAGYLGDSVTSEPATLGAGGPATISVAGQDSTSNWVVMGKIAPANRLSLPNRLTFRKAATKKVTMKNLGTASRTVTSARLTGDRTFRKLATSTCRNGLVLAPGASCTVAVRYRPKATRSTGTLTITDNVRANTVRLRGF